MKLTLNQIVGSVEQLNELVKVKMPFKASYAISRNIKKLAPEVETFNEKRKELLNELGTPKEDGQSYDLGNNFVKFQKELATLLDTEIEVDIHKLKVEDLGDTVVEPKLIVDFIFE